MFPERLLDSTFRNPTPLACPQSIKLTLLGIAPVLFGLLMARGGLNVLS
jgi:hypothetical protein